MYDDLYLSENECYGYPVKGVNSSSYAFRGDYIIDSEYEIAVFFNINREEIELHYGESVGDSWDLFTYPNSDRIVATVESINSENLFGQMENLKSIRLQKYDASNQMISSSIKDLALILSENYG